MQNYELKWILKNSISLHSMDILRLNLACLDIYLLGTSLTFILWGLIWMGSSPGPPSEKSLFY